MNQLCKLSIEQLIESIEENILETKEIRKRLKVEIGQERNEPNKVIKRRYKEKCDKDLFRFEMQKNDLKEMIREHALYAYKKLDKEGNEKTAQEGLVQEQLFEPVSSDNKSYVADKSILNPFIG